MAEPDHEPLNDILVETCNLTVRFPVLAGLMRRRPVGAVMAVDRINLRIRRGETLGLVGESGCGKSTLARAILRLIPATSGEVVFDGARLEGLTEPELRPYRRRMQIIFQDPFSSLNPRMTVGEAIAEAMLVHGLAAKEDTPGKVAALLSLVGLNPGMASRFPHEFSGGQRQRIGIARALAVQPDFIACDEPVSALDVSIQAQIVNLLDELRSRLGLTYLFVSHDLAVVRHISDRIAVMYLGQIVEIAPKERLYVAPLHPYTQALLSAVPVPSRKVEAQRKRQVLEGEVPSPLNPPPGCHLHPRCPYASAVCRAVEPVLEEVAPGHWVACHLYTAPALMAESAAIART